MRRFGRVLIRAVRSLWRKEGPGTVGRVSRSERLGKETPAEWLSRVAPWLSVREDLLRQALTHRSADSGGLDNERLEFLGDAVLQLVITEHLFRSHPEFTEGELTKARVYGVSEPTLADVARRIGLGEQIIMSRGEEASGGRDRPSILSDAFEALVGVVYLDQGLEAVRRFVVEHLADSLVVRETRDYKSLLQERAQERLKVTPRYSIVEESGPAHDKRFVAEVEVNGVSLGRGSGRSKKEAEQAAARCALEGFDRWIREQR